MMLPIVTGTRLEARKWPHVTFERSGVFCEATKAVSLLTKIPNGMKNMFATLCSKPAATKAVIGGMIARILSAVVRAL